MRLCKWRRLFWESNKRRGIDISLNRRITSVVLVLFHYSAAVASEADLILYNGKMVIVNSDFSIQQAVAGKDNHILRVGDMACHALL